jgi:hypothetical protein
MLPPAIRLYSLGGNPDTLQMWFLPRRCEDSMCALKGRELIGTSRVLLRWLQKKSARHKVRAEEARHLQKFTPKLLLTSYCVMLCRFLDYGGNNGDYSNGLS